MRKSDSLVRFLLVGGMLSALVACGDAANVALNDGHDTLQAPLGESCNLEGTWAMKITIPVSWTANIGIQGGQGQIVQWARSERVKTDDTTVVDTLVPCGSVVPDYRSQALFHSELYGTLFPDALFDNNDLPTTLVTTTLSGFNVGATYQSDFAPIQLGVKMSSPLTDTWPAKGSELGSVVDVDADGNPGVTLQASSEPGYSFPPTNMFGGKRADQFFVAVRNVASTSGTIDSCDKFDGIATVPVIAGKPAINSHVLGCHRPDGTKCTAAEAALLDRFQPNYLPENATAKMVRIDSTTSCAVIRAMTF
jgi:hypothetical protein